MASPFGTGLGVILRRIGAILMIFSAIPAGGAQTPLADAATVWHMNDERNGARDDCRLAVVGQVRLGLELEGDARAASLARGGDGRAACFEGGYLRIANDNELRIRPDQFTLAIRMRDAEGKWR
ncbi:MAG: hypothetical protein M1457_04700, partial [bacterium]|nr:hypothetical protein [bacterium]